MILFAFWRCHLNKYIYFARDSLMWILLKARREKRMTLKHESELKCLLFSRHIVSPLINVQSLNARLKVINWFFKVCSKKIVFFLTFFLSLIEPLPRTIILPIKKRIDKLASEFNEFFYSDYHTYILFLVLTVLLSFLLVPIFYLRSWTENIENK